MNASAPAPSPAPSSVCARLAPFGTTIFSVITRLAQQHGAINLAQGFPDFDGPAHLKAALANAASGDRHQYAPMPGIPTLRARIADRFTRDTSLPCDPDSNVTVTAGCTEAIAAALLGLLNPGDEVILFEPFYDSYLACIALAGATARPVSLLPPRDPRAPFAFDPAALAAAFTPRTRAVLLNTPHNPTGKVFTRAELELIASHARAHNAVVIADEVYERLVYAPAAHVSIASMPAMWDRTLTLSSIGKTFSFTGWKIGWAVGPAHLTAAVRAAHQFLTFAVNTPTQLAAAEALATEDRCVAPLLADYAARRAELADALRSCGLTPYQPDGAYFILADHSALALGDDAAFCTHLIERVGVAAIPPSAFYVNKHLATRLARFAFCKRPETIAQAAQRLRAAFAPKP